MLDQSSSKNVVNTLTQSSMRTVSTFQYFCQFVYSFCNELVTSTKLEKRTRRERLKSAPYLRLKKRKRFFLEKNWNFWKNFSFQKKSHSAEKCKRGTLLNLLTYIPLQNIKKLEGGTLWGQKKFSKKSRTVPKKTQRGTLSSRPVLYLTIKMDLLKGGTLCTISNALPVFQ